MSIATRHMMMYYEIVKQSCDLAQEMGFYDKQEYFGIDLRQMFENEVAELSKAGSIKDTPKCMKVFKKTGQKAKQMSLDEYENTYALAKKFFAFFEEFLKPDN